MDVVSDQGLAKITEWLPFNTYHSGLDLKKTRQEIGRVFVYWIIPLLTPLGVVHTHSWSYCIYRCPLPLRIADC